MTRAVLAYSAAAAVALGAAQFPGTAMGQGGGPGGGPAPGPEGGPATVGAGTTSGTTTGSSGRDSAGGGGPKKPAASMCKSYRGEARDNCLETVLGKARAEPPTKNGE